MLLGGLLRGVGRGLVGGTVADATAVAGGGFQPSSVASEVAEATGGTVSQLAKPQGFKVSVEVGKRTIVARVKSDGGFRVAIDGIGALTRAGEVSSDRSLTHLTATGADEVIDLVNRAKDLIQATRQ